MRIQGTRTKTGCVIIALAALVHLNYPAYGISLFMFGVAVAFYGLYDRVKRYVKKPMLRNGL